MVGRFSTPLIAALIAVAFTLPLQASVVFKPGEKSHYVPPGEEEINGNAQQLFQQAQTAENNKSLGRAIKLYRELVRRYPHDALAAGAGYRCAELQEQTKDYMAAVGSYRWIAEHYSTSTHFNDAMEAQFRIGEMYLNGKKIKWMGISVANALDRAVEIFAAIIRTAPYGKYTARAQYDIGRAREKEGANDAAIQAYQAVVDKFATSDVAGDAQYQIGYIWFTSARQGTNDAAAAAKARTAFEDFLYRYPNSEKSGQAKANLQMLDKKLTSSAYDIAKYYDKQKYYRAAVIYYNEVIRQQPGSAESEKAQKRIAELKGKVGEDKLKPAFAKAAEEEEAKKKAGKQQMQQASRGGGSGVQGSANDAAPLPPPEQGGSSLPPPPSGSSLTPDSAAPPSSLGGSGSEPSAAPDTNPPADPAASPAP